jgi:DNA-binding HxlR family transcriptional regulator
MDKLPCQDGKCPVNIAYKLIAGKWKLSIVWLLSQKTRRFGELQKLIPEISRGVLTQQLRELEHSGLVYREVFKEIPLKVEYSLTDIGESLLPIFSVLHEWGKSYLNQKPGETRL